jgi:hypothetical protein
MATWNDVHTIAPDLVDRARSLFTSTTNSVLATIRTDGTPRVSGIDPWFTAGEMYLGFMPDSRKLADLQRDPRLALHGIPWESRKVSDGALDPGAGDAKLTGTAVALDPASLIDVKAAFETERGFEMPDGDMFRVDLTSLVLISVEDDELVIDRWTEAGGRQTTRRK